MKQFLLSCTSAKNSLARGISILILIFSTHALVAQTEVCDTMISFATFNEPPALSCADVTITMHVGSTSGEDAATASLAFPTTSSITNAYIMVSGTFTIDKSFTFIDCYVFFNENAEMVTLEDEEVDLVGINTWFTNCEEKPGKASKSGQMELLNLRTAAL